MEDARRDEIGYRLFVLQAAKEGLTISKAKMREIGNVSRETGIPKEELLDFALIFASDVMEESFKNDKEKK